MTQLRRPRSLLLRHLTSLAPIVGALAFTAPAGAVAVDFEAGVPGSDTASLAVPGVSIGGGLVLSEALAQLLTGLPALGTWNTTPAGSQGALNTLDAVITLSFTTPVTSLSVDVLALPGPTGEPLGILLLGTDLGFDVSDALDPASDPAGDSGLPEATLAIAGTAISHALLCAQDPDLPGRCLAGGEPTTFWIDQLRFTPVPEAGTALLVASALAGFAARGRAH